MPIWTPPGLSRAGFFVHRTMTDAEKEAMRFHALRAWGLLRGPRTAAEDAAAHALAVEWQKNAKP